MLPLRQGRPKGRWAAPMACAWLVASVAWAQGWPPAGPLPGPAAPPAAFGPAAPSPYAPGQVSPGQPAPGQVAPSPIAPNQISAPPAPQTPSAEMVVEVRVVGNRAIRTSRILPHVRTRAGRPFEMRVLEEDVRRLDATGMFVNIKTSTQQVPNGRIVIFEVVERPTLRYIKFIGNKAIRKKILLKEAHLQEGDAADPFAVEEARRALEAYYHDRGFSQARVSIHEGNKPGDQGAVFVINEGPKQRILWTDFVGNTVADDARLRTQIESKQGPFWYFKGEFNKRKLEEDKQRLVAYFRSLGFFQAQVGVEAIPTKSGNWVNVTFVINEGPRYKVRDVYFTGNTIFSTQELGAELKLFGGKFFNQNEMDTDVRGIQEKYGSVGHIFADIQAQPRFLEEPGVLDLVYNVKEGDRYRVGRVNVNIKGEYPHTEISTVLNRMSLCPGDIVDIRELRDSERRLGASGLFEVNPQMNVQPKIVFSPSEAEAPESLEDDVPAIAQPSRPLERFRGQSPDGYAPYGRSPWPSDRMSRPSPTFPHYGAYR